MVRSLMVDVVEASCLVVFLAGIALVAHLGTGGLFG